jgi:hypothetical protein
MFVVILLAVGIAGFGYYRGWFALSTNNADRQPSATISVDKDKFQDDEQKARTEVQGLGQEAKRRIGPHDSAVKEPQPQH